MDIDDFNTNNDKNCVLKSEAPEITKNEPCMLGVDEAGRGPVLGPMVYGLCFCPLSCAQKLQDIKCADSKTLTEGEREKLFEGINNAKDFVGWMINIISPNVICNSMLKRSKYNLNLLSHDAAIGLIQETINLGVNVKEIYLDTVGDPAKYQAKLNEIFPGIDIVVAKKADSTYPIVSAASICAKVARDNALKTWKFREELDMANVKYGSGYPGDPQTKKFLQENMDPVFGYPQIVRFSWSTVTKILEEKAVPVVWDSDEEDEDKEEKDAAVAATPSILSFFKHSNPPSLDKIKHSAHQYFTDRDLQDVFDL